MELTRENILYPFQNALALYLTFVLLFTPYWWLTLIAGVLSLTLLIKLKKKRSLVKGKIWLYELFARHQDGQELDARPIAAIEERHMSTETIYDGKGEEGWMYYLKNEFDMVDMYFLNPRIPSEDVSPLIDYLFTDMEWRSLPQFRSYTTKKWRNKDRLSFDDIKKSLADQNVNVSRDKEQKKDLAAQAG